MFTSFSMSSPAPGRHELVEGLPRGGGGTQLPSPSQTEPARVWEFPALAELVEARPPMLPVAAEPAAATDAA